MSAIGQYDRVFLRLLRFAPFERRAGTWRFGTKRVADHIVDRLVAQGRVASDGTRAWLVTAGGAE